MPTNPTTTPLPATPGPATARRPHNPRRRLLLAAAAIGLPLALWRARSGGVTPPLRWEGTALGAPASLQLHADDNRDSRRALAATLAELARLEAMFSLYRADSVISQLNRSGRIDAAPPEFIELTRAALAMAAASQGVFDPSVQPLWQLYFDHLVVRGALDAPPSAAVAQALAHVDWRGVQVDGERVALARPGMGLTLNGIAQGYITDRCCAVLRAHGFDRMLVDMGEPRALASKPDGSAWQIGLADPRQPERVLHTVAVVEQAVATSGGYGTQFDAAGRYTHLLDPRSARTAPAQESVTVIAPTAALADALSTTLAVLPIADAAGRQAQLRRHPGCRAVCIAADGRVTELS